MDQNDAQLEQGAAPENDQVENNFASLLEQEDSNIDFPKQGEIRTGMIASISPGQILVSVGTKSEGIISGREFEAIPADEFNRNPGRPEIPVFVINPEDSSGNVVLSYVRAREEMTGKTPIRCWTPRKPSTARSLATTKAGSSYRLAGCAGLCLPPRSASLAALP